MMDDATLLGRYVETRSEEAFAELVQRHLPLVYSTALRRTNGDAHRAQDVAQVVFTALARDAAAFARHPALVGWLYTATRHAATDIMRSEQRRLAREKKAHAMDEILSAPEPEADWDRLRPVLDDVLDGLGAQDREAVLLRFFHRQQFAAVADVLRISEEAARKRVDRALDRLRSLLARRGITSTAGALALVLSSEAAIAVPVNVAGTVITTALAGSSAAASGGAAAVTFLHIMSTAKIVTTSAALAAVLAIGTALHQTQGARESAAAAASLQTERDALTSRLAAMEQRTQEADQALAAAQREMGELRSQMAKAAPAEDSQTSEARLNRGIDYVLKHPEAHAAYIQHGTLRALKHFEPFMQAAGFSAEQRQLFQKLLADQGPADLDYLIAMHAQGFGFGDMPSDPKLRDELLKPIRESRRAFFSEMRSHFGDEVLGQFMENRRAFSEHNLASELASRLYFTDAPLSAQQGDQLVRTLRENKLSIGDGSLPSQTMAGAAVTRPGIDGARALLILDDAMMEWSAPISDAAAAQAETFLSPTQIVALRRLQAEQATQYQWAPPPPPRLFIAEPR